VFLRLLAEAGLDAAGLSVGEIVTWGRRADDTASFCAVVADEAFAQALEALRAGPRWSEVEVAAAALEINAEAAAQELLVFEANLGVTPLRLDTSAPTAHGSGGAVDVFLVDRGGRLVNLGVPFDSASEAAEMSFFDRSTLPHYQDLVAADPGLRVHLTELGVDPTRVTAADFEAIRAERRLLFHAMNAVGATFFSLGYAAGEPWHFNLSNEDGGKQAMELPGAGNACQSLLRDVRDRVTGCWTAVWGNAAAHTLAAAWDTGEGRRGSEV
jgi:D-alanyl-D-alanine dipeptidase